MDIGLKRADALVNSPSAQPVKPEPVAEVGQVKGPEVVVDKAREARVELGAQALMQARATVGEQTQRVEEMTGAVKQERSAAREQLEQERNAQWLEIPGNGIRKNELPEVSEEAVTARVNANGGQAQENLNNAQQGLAQARQGIGRVLSGLDRGEIGAVQQRATEMEKQAELGAAEQRFAEMTVDRNAERGKHEVGSGTYLSNEQLHATKAEV